MTPPYRYINAELHYACPPFVATILARVTQRSAGLSRAALAQGRHVIVSMYGQTRTPEADNLLTGVAWFGRGYVPRGLV